MSATIKVGHIDLSFHDASALEVEKILAEHGHHQIERSAAPHEEMFKRLGRGEVDILVSAWLPASHAAYLKPLEDQVYKVTVLYEPYCIWGVPDYVPEADVGSIADLLHEPALGRMARLIQGINPGAGISRFSKEMIVAYDLEAAGYHFETGSEAACFDRFEQAYTAREWIVIPLWHPQYLHARYRIRSLSEPKGLLGGSDSATLLVRKDAAPRIGEPALSALAELYLGNNRVSELDDRLRRSATAAYRR